MNTIQLIVTYIHTDIAGSTNHTIDPAELQSNSTIIHYVKLPPHTDNDNNGPKNDDTDTDNNYIIVKNHINNIHENNYYIHCNYTLRYFEIFTNDNVYVSYDINQPQRHPRAFYEQPSLRINTNYHYHLPPYNYQ